MRFTAFSFSLCESADLLSQWRAYASNEAGIAVGFRGPDLNEWSDKRIWRQHVVRFAKVIYGDAGAEAFLKLLVDAYSLDLDSYLASLSDQPQKDRALEVFADRACISLQVSMPLLKRLEFQEELEWRLVTHTLYDDAAHIKLRSRGPYIIPYVELMGSENPMADAPTDPRLGLPIGEVVLGPRYPDSDVSLAQRSLHQYAFLRGRHPIPARKSEIRLRVF